jgi:hypothetical protein
VETACSQSSPQGAEGGNSQQKRYEKCGLARIPPPFVTRRREDLLLQLERIEAKRRSGAGRLREAKATGTERSEAKRRDDSRSRPKGAQREQIVRKRIVCPLEWFARLLPDYCRTTAGLLPDYCRTTARLLPDYCRTTAGLLPDYCQTTARPLPDRCRTAAGPRASRPPQCPGRRSPGHILPKETDCLSLGMCPLECHHEGLGRGSAQMPMLPRHDEGGRNDDPEG